MSTGKDQLTRLQYEEEIDKLGGKENPLLKRIAMEQYDIKIRCHEICGSSQYSKKQAAFNVTGVTAAVIAVIEGVLMWWKSGGVK